MLKSELDKILLSFTTLFSPLGLSPRAVSTSFGCRQNIAICLQGASSPDPTTVFVDLRALRYICSLHYYATAELRISGTTE